MSPPPPPPLNRADQTLATFNRLRKAARTVFLERGYDDVPMDEIARRAGVTRATIYLHFGGKLDLLFSVLDGELEEQIGVYRKLSELPRLTRNGVRTWLGQYRDAYDSRRNLWDLWRHATQNEAERGGQISDHRERAISVLSERYPAFRYRHLPPALADRRRAEIYLLLFQMESVVRYFSTADNTPNIAIGLDLLVDRIIAFCKASG